MVSSFRADEHTFSLFCLEENSLPYSIENECIVINIPKKKIDAKLILKILIDLIFQSKHPSVLLFNIILQRLLSKVSLDKEVLVFAQEEIRRRTTSAIEGGPAQEPIL